MKVASILIPQAKPLYPCLLFEKTLFSPDGRSVFMKEAFLDQFAFIFLNMEAECETRGAVQPKPYAKAEPPNTKNDAHTDWIGKSASQPSRDS